MVGVCRVPCYRPIKGYRRADGTVAFVEHGGNALGVLEVPCGQCVGCRLERSRQWAMRCVHESQMHKSSCFVTLTYDDVNLPPGASLYYVDYQRFMKRLRKYFTGTNVRFYMCGEYGEATMRPHYHSLLFGVNFPDKRRFSKGPDGSYLCTSDVLSKLWPHGNSLIGDVTFQSAAYVARYCMKKVTGSQAVEYYKSVNLATGEIFDRVPEFNKMSLKPGIGATWLEKFQSDVYPRNYVVMNGVKVKPPKYYDRKFEAVDAMTLEMLKYDRALKAVVEDNTVERLAVREKVAIARTELLKRDLE